MALLGPMGITPSNLTESVFCVESSSRSSFSLAIGALLTVGACASYLPQHIAVLRSRSVKGMSWPWLFMSCIAALSLLVNVVCLRWDTLRCCSSLSAERCQVVLLPVYQVGVGILNTLPLFAAYVYLRVDGDDRQAVPSRLRRLVCPNGNPDKWARNAFFGFLLFYMFPALLVAALLVGLRGGSAVATISFGATLGGISAIASALMWLPQIVYTIRNRDGGNLSLLMLCIQLPGNFAAVYFQAIVEQEGITTFGPYLASGLEQLVLIFILVYFRFRAFRLRRKELREASSAQTDSEWETETDDDSSEGEGERDGLLEAQTHLVGSKSAEGFASAFVNSLKV